MGLIGTKFTLSEIFRSFNNYIYLHTYDIFAENENNNFDEELLRELTRRTDQ